jgi:hypothetical protein
MVTATGATLPLLLLMLPMMQLKLLLRKTQTAQYLTVKKLPLRMMPATPALSQKIMKLLLLQRAALISSFMKLLLLQRTALFSTLKLERSLL